MASSDVTTRMPKAAEMIPSTERDTTIGRPPLPPPPPELSVPARPQGYDAIAATNRVHLPAGVTVANPWTRLGAYLLEGLLGLLTLGIGWLIWAAMLAGNGQTPAKKLLSLRVIGADTLRPVGFGKMFWVRGFVAGLVAPLAVVITLGIILLMPFWDKRRQNIWDKVSNTYVVTDPNDAWGCRPDLR